LSAGESLYAPDVPRRPRRRALRALLACSVVAALATVGALVPTVASASASFAVTTLTDHLLTAGCDDGIAGTSLREALCLASAASPAAISLPAGTYALVAPLDVEPAGTGSTLVVTGAGAGLTTIDAAGRRAFDLDSTLTGGLNVTLSSLTITNAAGPAADLGGGAILAGSGVPGAPDALTLTDCAVSGNANAPAGNTSADAAGGAVSMTGGSLTINRCTFDGNTAYGAPGGAVAFMGVDASDSVTVSGSTFTGNAVQATAASGVVGGGAIYVVGMTGQPTTTVTGTTFDANTVVSAAVPPAFGSSVYVAGGTATISGSSVLGGHVTGSAGSGGAVWLRFGSVTTSRLSGNTTVVGATTTNDAVRGTGVTATGNWWGCADPRTSTGCQTAPDALTVLPAAVLTAAASPTIAATGDTVGIAGTLLMSDGSALPAALAAQMAVAPVTWSAGVTGEATVGADLIATGSLTMGAASATATVTVDGASVSASVQLEVAASVSDPVSTTVPEHTAAQFVVLPGGTPAPTVTWESAAPGSSAWTTVSGANGPVLTVPSVTRAQDGTRYRAVASNGVGASATSAPATLTVTWGPEIGSGPADVTVVAGQPATFTVTAAGGPAPAYQWQTSANGTTWTDVAGASSATYSRTTTAADDGLLVRVHVTGATPVDSASATLTVQQAGALSPPASVVALETTTATFTVTPTGFDPAPTIRWQRWSGTAWVDVPGATLPTLTLTAQRADDGARFRAVATTTFVDATTATTVSAEATLSVQWDPSITTSPTAAIGAVGDQVTFTAAAQGNPAPTVAWQVSTNGTTWTPVAATTTSSVGGTTTTTYSRTLVAGDAGLLVRAVFAGPSASVSTTPVAVTIAHAATITGQPAAATVDEGSTATFAVGVGGTPAPAIRWQSDSSGAWADLPGETGAMLTVTGTAALDGVHVRAVASNGFGSATSSSALLMVLAAPTLTDPVDVTTAPGVPVTFQTTATGRPAPLLTWQTSPDGVAWTDAGTGPALSLTPALADDGLQVRVVATSTTASGPARVVSSAATLTVIALPTFVSGPPAATAATAGSPVTLSWVVLSSGGTPTWQVSRDGGATWVAPPAGFATSTVTGVAFVQALRGAAPATRTAYVVTFTPTAADGGLMVGLTVTNAVGSTGRGTTTLAVAAAPAPTPVSTVGGSSDPTGGGQAGASGQLSSTGSNSTPLLVAALLALLAGGLVLGLRRRLNRR
jgi:hypothetical protein